MSRDAQFQGTNAYFQMPGYGEMMPGRGWCRLLFLHQVTIQRLMVHVGEIRQLMYPLEVEFLCNV
jgi:hypothetical protein